MVHNNSSLKSIGMNNYSTVSTANIQTEKQNVIKFDININEEQPSRNASEIVIETPSPTTSGTTDEFLEVNEVKNIITKDDVEKVLDLKFVKSYIKQDSFVTPGGIEDMKISYHNLGAFQAYERSRARRISEMAWKKYGQSIMSSKNENEEYTDQHRHNEGTRPMYGATIKKSSPNINCHPENKNCHLLHRTRRLAEVLISNIEEIKFLGGGPCDLCGRHSCDGFNHFPDAPPIEKVTQVDKSDIVIAQKKPSLYFDETNTVLKSVKLIASTMLPSERAFAMLQSNEVIEGEGENTKVESIENGDENVSLKSIHTSEGYRSMPSNESIEYPSIFSINFKYIKLEADGLDTLEFATRATKGYKFKYVFLMYRESVEFVAIVEGIDIKIHDKRVHEFSMNPIVYQYLYNCCLHIELYDIPINTKRSDRFIGNCDLCFKKILSSVGQSHQMKLLITDRDRIAFVSHGKETDFGYLFLDVTLRGDEDQLNNLSKTVHVKRSPIDVMGTGSFTEFMECTDSVKSLSYRNLVRISEPRFMIFQTQYDAGAHTSVQSLVLTAFEKGLITEAEHKAFYDALQLVLVRNKALRTHQSEIDMELNDRAEWMHEELKWRLTLQEHAILSGKDPESVRWRQWRDENTFDVRFRTIMDEEIEYEPVIVITVEQLEILPLSHIMLDESIKLIYVEYAFLTHSGLELETKSMPKNAEGLITYNFVRRFDIGIHKENLDTQVLAEHIKTNQCIKFTIVQEPIEDSEDLQTCDALGSCEINLFNLAQHVSNTHEDVYQLKNAKTGAHDVGHLKLRFDGVRAMRTVALMLLAPTAFKIYR